jgi:peptidoglycan-N-acetylglucosamine deacetylase
MRNKKLLNIVPIVMLAVLIPLSNSYPAIRWWGFGAIVFAQLSILFYGCVTISSGYFMPVICKANTNEKIVALTFDDGPNATYTNTILDTLKQYDVKAAFFCIGKHIAGNEAILKRIKDEGHIIGNHSYSHDFWFDMYGAKKMLTDLQQMDGAVMNTVGVKPLLFRPPYGVVNPNVRKATLRGRYIPVGWSIRSLDTTAKDKQKLLSRIMGRIKGGDIILLHDSMQITAEILPELLEQIKNKGYQVVPLDKMLNVPAYV